ncbi:MAG: ABC transporter permease subunit [Clostridium sp.]
MIFTLIKNELIKIFKRGKTWIVFALFALTIAGMGVISYKEAKNTEYYQSPEGQIESLKDSIKYSKSDIEYYKTVKEEWAKEEITNAESRIKELEKQINTLEEEIKNNKDNPNEWRESLEEEKKTIEDNLKDSSYSEDDKVSFKQRLEEINIYLDKNMKPIEEWEFNGINYGIKFIFMIGTLILAAGIAVFMSDIVSGECTPPTLKFLLVQPISRGKVILSKFIAVVITVVTMIGGLEALVVAGISAFTGFDAGKMPQYIGKAFKWDYTNAAENGGPQLAEVAGSGVLSTRWMYLLESFGLQILFIIACCAFIFMISAIFKSSMITMAVSVILCVAATIIPEMSQTIRSISRFFFTSYGDTTSLVSGYCAMNFNNPNVTLGFGVIVMIATTIVSYIIGHIVFNKKDILI